MERPERSGVWHTRSWCCIRLGRASPAAVSAAAPRRRLRAWAEIPPPAAERRKPCRGRMASREGSEPAGRMRKRALCSLVREKLERGRTGRLSATAPTARWARSRATREGAPTSPPARSTGRKCCCSTSRRHPRRRPHRRGGHARAARGRRLRHSESPDRPGQRPRDDFPS
jgi:hypothetical protein